MNLKVGDEVGWLWANGLAIGKVKEIHATKHSIVSKGKTITRNGKPDDPAVVIEHKRGNLVIKLYHELQNVKEPIN